EPNVYYIPPIHAPREYLRQMFGPGVDEAVETYQQISTDDELLGLMMLFGSTERIMHSFAVADGIATGYDEDGTELVSVPLREPTFIREYFDEVHNTYRQNIS
ncbi:MAG: dehydrogenase, partial [Dehalococcoidia bacterium]